MSTGTPHKLIPADTPLVILAEGCFGTVQSKTGTGVIQYGTWPITAVIDSQSAGKTVSQVMGGPCQASLVASLAEALQLQPRPKALLIGTAPMGGGLPVQYQAVVKEAIQAGLHIISGLHVFLNDIPELKALAAEKQVLLWDVRAVPPEYQVVAQQLPRPAETHVVTMVGSDCSVGKMFTALELNRALQAQGESSAFVATGQTGIMISGTGIPLDRVIGDFMAGALEKTIAEVIQTQRPCWVMVEGQGSLLHPGYSSVTLALLHGSAPVGLILCHNPALTSIRNYERIILPSLPDIIKIYEAAVNWIRPGLKPTRVLGISLNTSRFSEAEALALITAAERDTSLPATDPVRYGVEKLVQALKRVL